MSTYQPGDRTPLESRDQLLAYFQPPSPVVGRMGVEWELMALDARGRMAPYAGPEGVEAALKAVAPGARAILEDGHLTALRLGSGGMVGLEPGAQLEVATPPATDLAAIEGFLRETAGRLAGALEPSGRGLFAVGCAPLDGPEDHPDVPKARYAVLGDHLRGAGTQGRRMMKLTAAAQFSIDYQDERDLRHKVALLLPLLPTLVAFSANSPFARGRRTRWQTQRPQIWRGTDRLRCGLPDFFFSPDLGFEHFVRYGLSRPLLMLVRDGRYLRGDGRTFAKWWRDPGPAGPLTMEDWDLHWSTLFPDLRPRHYLEIRVADSVPLPLLMALSALLKGLLSDTTPMEPLRRQLPTPTPAEVRRAIMAAARSGPRWRTPGRPEPTVILRRALGFAARGLKRLGENPSRLEPLEALAARGLCPADLWGRTPGGPWPPAVPAADD